MPNSKPFQRLSDLARTSILVLALCASPAAADQQFSFGVVPQFEARRLSEIWTPILEQLEARTGLEFKMIGSPRIPEFEQAFGRGEFDFSYMNPYHSLVAFSRQGYEPLVRDGDRKLSGVLVVTKDSPYKTVSDLENARIAFPAPNAFGASLLIRANLDRVHDLNFVPDFVNTHSSAYLNVVLGEADAAGGVMSTFMALDPDVRDHLRILYETPEMPPHPIVVHPRVPREIAERVQRAFLEIAATPEGAEILSKIPMRRAVATQASDYGSLTKLELEDYYVESGSN